MERLLAALQIALGLGFLEADRHRMAAEGRSDVKGVMSVPLVSGLLSSWKLVASCKAPIAHDKLMVADILFFADDADRSRAEVEGFALAAVSDGAR